METLLVAVVLPIVAVALGAQSPRGQSYEEMVKRFDYDSRAPLDLREVSVENRAGVKVHDISYASPKGGRVPAYLVVPEGNGPFAAVIWGHWYWGNSEFRNRREFLDEAVVLASSGVVSLLFDGPVARPGFYQDRSPLNEKQIDDRVQTILDVRRGADLLLARPDVDGKRLAYVGHSYNASTGGYLAGVDKRFKAFVLMAGSLSDKVDLESQEYRNYRNAVGPETFDGFIAKTAWLDPGVYLPHAAPASVLMQYATKEDFLTVARAKRYAELVSEPKRFEVYEAPHALNEAARRDRFEFLQQQLGLGAIDWTAVAKIPELVQPQKEPPVQRKTCTSPDGVTIVYSAAGAGAGDAALLFIHGGFADRSFFDAQISAFSGRYRVIAVDLAGHGESGRNRSEWSVARFAADVKAVADAERVKRVVLFGNSLGGPVAIEAALLLPGRAIGVVGIDTFQDLGHERTPEYRQREAEATRQRADAFHKDFAGSMKAMVGMLFHPDADPRLKEETERRMTRTAPDVVYGVLAGLAGYDYTPAARRLTIPLRAINGDLYPTDVQAARRVKADFDAVVVKHAGHYPMLERPDEFNRLAGETVTAILASAGGATRVDRPDLTAARAKYPAHWWAPVPKEGAPAWEILPQEAAPGEVIVSKRHELGLLSNFAATPFVFRGVRYASLEGFWQMMLYPEGPDDPRAGFPGLAWAHTRGQVSQMAGFEAKDAGTLAEQNMARMGIDWVTFEAERFPYRPDRPGRHHDLIVAAMREKIRQNPQVQQVLLATGDLILRPDHHEEAGARAAWRYCDILTQIRADLKSGR